MIVEVSSVKSSNTAQQCCELLAGFNARGTSMYAITCTKVVAVQL